MIARTMLPIALILLLPLSSLAVDCVDYSQYVSWQGSFLPAAGGEPQDLLVQGARLIVATGTGGVEVWDLTDPENPSFDCQPSSVHGATQLDRAGDTMVALGLDNFIECYDLSPPGCPASVGHLTFAAPIQSMAADGELAVVSTGGANIVYVVDISDPTLPVQVGTLNVPGGALVMQAIQIVGDRAFLGVWDLIGFQFSFKIIDLSVPSAPQILGQFPLPEEATDFALLGDVLYVSVNNNETQIVDVSDPGDPLLLGTIPGSPGSRVLEVAGDRLYTGWTHLIVYDVSNPVAPAEIAFCDYPRGIHSLASAGDWVYVTVSYNNDSVHRISVATPATLPSLDTLSVGIGIDELVLRGNLLHLAASVEGYVIVDVSDPENFAVLGSVVFPYPAKDLLVESDIAYVGTGYWNTDFSEGAIEILDVSAPATPAVLGSIDLGAAAYDLALRDDLLYVTTSGPASFRIYDVADPGDPALLGMLPFGSYYAGRAIMLIDDLAYFYYWSWDDIPHHGDLRIADVSDPTAPVIVDEVLHNALIFDLVPDGGRVYAPCGSEGVKIFDFSNPLDPVELNRFALEFRCLDFAKSGDNAYVVGIDGLFHYDLSDPMNPVFLAMASTVNSATDVKLGDDVLYLLASDLYAFPLDCFDETSVLPGASPSASIEIDTWPNPFNPSVRIRFNQAAAGPARVEIFDISGRRSRTLAAGRFDAGNHELVWDGTDDEGRLMGSGLYFARVLSDAGAACAKLVLMK